MSTLSNRLAIENAEAEKKKTVPPWMSLLFLGKKKGTIAQHNPLK